MAKDLTYTGVLVCDEPLFAIARQILADLHVKFLPFEVGFDIEAITAPQYDAAIERIAEIAGRVGESWSFTRN